ncbi:MAG: SusD/RagB family nutrient-binding outer membrane lipoprotein [Bacteroidaceae bacterium]|nr:SusD/RagB family nutrient-binding outer membrane lipoprotein [Bacteroidaceae bacterium]
MKTINKIANKLLMVCCLGMVTLPYACTDGFEDLNKFPYAPPYEPSGNVDPDPTPDPFSEINFAPSVTAEELADLEGKQAEIGSTFKTFTYEGLANDYQRTTNLTHDIYAGYFWTNKKEFLVSSPNYVYSEGWSSLRWSHFYKERTTEYQSLARTFRYVDYAKYKNAFYITRIYYAYLAATMSDTYGDLPFKDLVKGLPAAEKSVYDSQEKVYDLVFKVLAQATDSIKPGQCEFVFDAADDKCFGGDEAKWMRFANSLRLNLALRISNADPARAKLEGEAAMAQPAGLMSSTADRMKTVPRYAPVEMGGENAGGEENEIANCSFRYVDAVMSKDLENAYRGQSAALDPRCTVCWFKPSPMDMLLLGNENRRTEYTGCPIGSNDINHTSEKYSVLKVNSWEDKTVLRDDYWFGYSREFYWFGYAQSKFCEAEAALRGWAGANGTPQSLFEEGIRASISGYYHMSSSVADAYISGLKIYSGEIDNPFETGDKEGMLEQIITQKWLASFPNGNEGWADFRRTDYPRLLNVLDNRDANIPMGKFIKRINYPYSEMDNNSENVPNINQGTRVWWDVQDTNNAAGERNTPNNFR